MRFLLGPDGEAVERRVAALVAEGASSNIWRHNDAFWGTEPARRASVADRLGWLDVVATMQNRVDELQAFAQEIRDDGYTDAVVLGMGGSSLAPEVMRLTLPRARGFPALHVLDTTDPKAIRSLESRISIDRTLFIVSSKSGTTIEPNCLFEYFHAQVEEHNPADPGKQFIAITDSDTSLSTLAEEKAFRGVFTNPSDIGGRYSALSYFGLVPAAVAGIDVARLLATAAAEADAAREPESPSLRLGVALGELANLSRNKCTFVTSPAISSFGLWLEQLIAESTGKHGRGALPVSGEPLATPKHYADDRFFVQIRLGGGYEGESDATCGALVAEGFPLIRIDLDTPYDLGREFFRWEFAVAIAGKVLGINPFDEPNVQESKDNTARVLAEFTSSGSIDSGAGAADIGALSSLLGQLNGHAYFAITAYMEQTPDTDDAFADIRRIVRDATGCATTLGYGPRFLHSTGQMHKGGPPEGVFLQVTSIPNDDVTIPGRPYTFGQLERAQSIGDYESLESHGRPVLRVQLPSGSSQSLRQLRAAVSHVTTGAVRVGR